MRDTFADYVFEKAKLDNKIRLITADLGFGVFDNFASELPDQFINSGVTEQATVSMAAGLSEFSSKVFVYSIANFVTFRPLEQIRNDICYPKKNVCLVAVGAGYSYGALGYSHHLIEDLSIMTALPNLKIYSPSNPNEVKLCLQKIFEIEGPSYLRLGRSLFQGNLEDNAIHETYCFRYFRIGKNGTIIFTGGIEEIAKKVQEGLEIYGYDFSVASFPFICNVSEKELVDLAKHGDVITLEEHTIRGGIGSFLATQFNNLNLNVNLHIYGLNSPNNYEIGSQEYLRRVNNLDSKTIVNWALSRLQKD
jgi:transketolase